MLEQRINNYWNGRSRGYSSSIKEEISSFKKQAWQELIKKFAGGGRGLKALDVGTGPGFFAIIMAELGYKVTAMDRAEKMLREGEINAQLAGVQVDFHQGDVLEIPFTENSFDLVVSRNLVWTLPTPEQAYREWHRVLNNGGRVLVFDGNWYYRLTDPAYMKKYERFRLIAKSLGIEESVPAEKLRECEEIARQLPLTYQFRPRWDERALSVCGFRNIQVEEEINSMVYDENEKVLYGYTSLFAVCGQKDSVT